ncbi:MAG: molybdopterin-binding protein [Pedobacter sp.]|uniref:molybdopterin-binding protein n=1 Tax=Pedobacter sp. TaxID=1411316 RepID=UPI00339AD89D
MISIKEAKLIILEHSRKVPFEPIPLAMALGSTLATDLYPHHPTIGYTRGSELTDDAIGYLSTLGLTEVQVFRQPTVGIIVAAKDLLPPGKAGAYGKVLESNSYALTAALKQNNITRINFYNAQDTVEGMTAVLREALKANDVLILTCGMTVGCYGFVISAAEQAGIRQIFNKVRQKPGRPLYFGETDHQVVFGLPGNYATVLNNFYAYVLPAIQKLSNFKSLIKKSRQV